VCKWQKATTNQIFLQLIILVLDQQHDEAWSSEVLCSEQTLHVASPAGPLFLCEKCDCMLPAQQNSDCIMNTHRSWPTPNRQALSKCTANIMALYITLCGLLKVTQNAALLCMLCISHLADLSLNFPALSHAVGQLCLCLGQLQSVSFSLHSLVPVLEVPVCPCRSSFIPISFM